MKKQQLQIILLLHLIFTTYSCQKCVELTWHSCQICYENCQSGVTLKSCTAQKCASYFTDSAGNTHCQFTKKINISQENCFFECCGDDVAQTQNFSIQALNQCKQYNDIQTTTLIASLSAVCSLILLCFVVLFCKDKVKEKCQSNQCCLNCCKREEADNPASGTIKNKWQKDKSSCFDIENHTSLCTICLMNKVNAITNCGHIYHLRCLINWYNKNTSCPVCLSESINPIKIYFRSCFTGYYEIQIQRNSEEKKINENFKGSKCPICS